MEESFSAAEYDALRDRIEELERRLETVRGNAQRWEELALRYKREFAETAIKTRDENTRLREALESSEYQLRQFIRSASLTMTQRKRLREINAVSSKAVGGESVDYAGG